METGKYNLLLVEDEESLAKTLALNLGLEGYKVQHAASGTEALKYYAGNNATIHLVLLDVMLPGINGFDLCAEFKKMNPQVPVIFLTAKNSSSEKISGLKLGADDYIVKPFELEELMLRISNVLKRSSPKPVSEYAFEGGAINFDTFEIKDRNGRRETLSKREIGLLKLLTDKENKVVSRDEIIEKLWDVNENASSRTIDNYILSFRKHFEANPREPKHFHSVRGVGYKFTA
jgi:two-component system alkaline phosphatase synthesis response regulator PhoP